MQVKCKACGNKIDRDIAFKIVINNKNNYYCNENEYRDIQREKQSREQIFILIKEIIGNTTNTILFKELKTLTDAYSNYKVLNYLENNKPSLISNMNKKFGNEFGKIRYFFAIIKNSIGDFEEISKQEDKKDIKIEYVEVKYKPKKRKKSLNEYFQEYKEDLT